MTQSCSWHMLFTYIFEYVACDWICNIQFYVEYINQITTIITCWKKTLQAKQNTGAEHYTCRLSDRDSCSHGKPESLVLVTSAVVYLLAFIPHGFKNSPFSDPRVPRFLKSLYLSPLLSCKTTQEGIVCNICLSPQPHGGVVERLHPKKKQML